MRRTLLFALAGVATLASGCGAVTAQSGAVIPQALTRPAAAPARPPAVASQSAFRAALAKATKTTLAAGSAMWSETVLLPGASSVAHVSANEPADEVGDLDFANNRGHVVVYVDPLTVHQAVEGLMVTGGKLYQIGPDGNGIPSTGVTETNPTDTDYFVQVLNWETGPITFAGYHRVSGLSGLYAGFSYAVNLTALNDGVLASPSADSGLASLPTRQSVWLDAQGRIVALIDTIDLSGHPLAGIPAGVTQAVVLQRFTSFGVPVYQHLDVPVNATSPEPSVPQTG